MTDEPKPATPANAPKPQFKPRKVFVPKKVVAKSDKPQECRTRHILVSSRESADLIRQIILDFAKELAAQPSEELDKEFEDRQKLETFFSRLAKKYSICPTRNIGGELGWLYKGMEFTGETINAELVEAVVSAEKYTVPEPVRTPRGFHLILVCESQNLSKKPVQKDDDLDPRYKAMMDDPTAQPPTHRGDIPK